jgi:hypothetical protein
MNDDGLGIDVRTLDPEGSEERKLFTFGRGGVDGEPAC